MTPINISELKRIQLDILQAIHEFCQENGIKYSLACGSLLGAIRHNGYIPWDDDIDIYLLREDFIKLQKSFPNKYKGYLDLITLETDAAWNRPYGKVHDTRTVMKEKTSSHYHLGINIDVFPLDNAPDNEKTWQKYNKKRKFLQHIFEAKFVKLSSSRSITKNTILFLTKILISPIRTRQFALYLSKLAQKYNKTKCDRLFENVQGILQQNPFLKSDFKDIELHTFEDREFNIMIGWDDCLKNGFGNYMQLPPVEKRVSHHAFKAYWKD